MDDTVLMHLLPMMVERPNLRPTTGLMMPAAWRLELYQEGLDAVDETVTDGNCGIHAFAIGLIDAAGGPQNACNHFTIQESSAPERQG